MVKRGGNKSHKNLIITLIVILVISQAVTIYLIFDKSSESLDAINNAESKLNQQITLNQQDAQSKINTITTTLQSVTTLQEDFQEELGEIKATTSSDFSGIIETEIEGVVTIKTDISQGTGFLITETGYLVTNYHVIQGAKAAGVFTSDNQQHQVSLVGHNANMDVALLKIEEKSHAIELGDSDDVKVGEKVLAIGNPLGLSFTATEGIISALHRKGSNELPYYFQTDVSLNPGNSGGPLLNTQGQVIGINNFKISDAENIGFALEINHAKDAINEIAIEALNETLI
jgi:S1-C subfamily serine protease